MHPVLAAAAAAVVALSNGHVTRTWTVDGASVSQRSLDGWATAGPDFRIEVDGVPTTSALGWSLQSVQRARRSVTFTYGLAGATLTRTFTLVRDTPVIEAHTVLVNGPAPLRVGAATLDQVTAAKPMTAEVGAYHGGSDWRDDYRTLRTESGAFDDEGEQVRLDDGHGAGFFEVAERRSGAASRAGRDAAGRTWVSVDPARDAFDAGPLKSDPPDYNRVANPAYPVPVRARTVAPFGRLDLGRAWTGVYRHGDAGVVFADAFAPRFPRTVGLNSFHPWNHGDGMSDANLRRQVDAAQALGVESFMLDDQWQGGAGGESGDWRFDPARFPDADHDGVPDFVTYLHAHGLKLGLWMSPLEFNSASETAKAHPDWICTPTGDVTAQVPDDAGLGVWDATNPAFQDYLTGVVDRLVAAYDVREFKFDFMAWVDCPPHDYLDYEDAFRALVRRFEARHPGVTFELDETNDQRLWPFASAVLGPSWFDNGHLHGSTAQAKLLHDVWTAAPWLPPSEIGTGLYDGTLTGAFTPDFLMPVALLGHVTFWSDLTKLTADQRSRTAQWIAWYKAHRGLLSRGAYELTAHDPLDGRGWAAFEPHRGRAAALFAFRQAGGDAAQTFVLQGLDPDADYTVVRAPDGAALGTFSGARLMSDGLRVALPEQSAAVLLATPDRRTPAGG